VVPSLENNAGSHPGSSRQKLKVVQKKGVTGTSPQVEAILGPGEVRGFISPCSALSRGKRIFGVRIQKHRGCNGGRIEAELLAS